jgi:hypothetical protein
MKICELRKEGGGNGSFQGYTITMAISCAYQISCVCLIIKKSDFIAKELRGFFWRFF